MSVFIKIDKWKEQHHYALIDIARVLFGIFLVAKGSSFIDHREQIEWLLVKNNIHFLIFIAAIYIVLLHIGGGLLMMTGLITRWAAAFQIPILIGAVFFINLPIGFNGINTETGISIATLVLLIFFFFYGSGNYSLDYYVEKHEQPYHRKFF